MLTKKKVLFVDDDEIIRKMTALMLEKLGYQVLEASSPDKAISLFEKEKTSIDLLLTDVMMPGMNGYELRNRINKLMPGINTLFISSHSMETLIILGITEKNIHFLQKPFTISNLDGKIKEAIESSNNLVD